MSGISRFGEYLLRSPYKAGTVALVFGALPLIGMPFFSWIAIVIVGLVALRQGSQSGFIVLVAQALIPVIVGFYDGNYILLVREVILGSLIVYLLALILRNSGSWRWVLEYSVWCGVAAVLAAHLMVDDLPAWWISEIKQLMALVHNKTLGTNMNGTITADDILWFSRVATGCAAAWFITSSLINLALARWWQARLFNPQGLRQELVTIRLGWSVVAGFGVCAVLGLLGLSLFLDFLPLFVAGLFASGLSFIHYYAGTLLRRRKIALLVFYGMVIAVAPYAIAVVVCIALADSVLDLRVKLTKERG